MEVFVKVALASLSSLVKVKLSCKDFCVLVEIDYIFQHVLLKELPEVWFTSDKVLSFLKPCKESGNPDAVLRAEIQFCHICHREIYIQIRFADRRIC